MCGHFGDGRAAAGRLSEFGRVVAEMNLCGTRCRGPCGQRPTDLPR